MGDDRGIWRYHLTYRERGAVEEAGTMKKWGFIILGLVVLLRVAYITVPIVEPFNNITRQSIGATVARNFYQHGFNFLYPEIDENGRGPYLHNVEMPLCTYLIALLYKLTGGVSEGWARMVSVLFSLVMLFFLYRLVRKISDERVALCSVFFAGLSPMSMALSRSIQPDIATLAFCVMALDRFHDYRTSSKPRDLVLSAIFFCLAVATKIYALYLFIPIVYLAWQRDGKKIFIDGRNYLYAGIVLLALIWYWRMWQVGREVKDLAYPSFHYPPGILQGPFGYFKLFLPPLVILPLKTLILHILTPVGLLCFVRGVLGRLDTRQTLVWAWLGGVVFYLLVMWPTAVIHPYYLLFLVPPLSFFMARGAVRWMDALGKKSLMLRNITVALALLCYLGFGAYYYRLLYFIPQDRQAIVDAGQAVASSTPKDALVVAAYGTSPIQLYYCNRKGWLFDLSGEDSSLIEELKRLRREGARIFVTTEKERLTQKEAFALYLQTTSNTVRDASSYTIYELGDRFE